MKFLSVLLFVFVQLSSKGQTSPKRYTKVPGGYLMVLRQGDVLIGQLESLMQQENIPSANFTGMGFAEVEFGFFNSRSRKYKSKKIKAGEIASMHGSLAWQDGKPSVHAHGVLSNNKFKTRGGHILSAIVGTGSLEIMIHVHDKRLERKKDEVLGANVLDLDK
jgi:predicted DNA-binding protein with PD1-like motif